MRTTEFNGIQLEFLNSINKSYDIQLRLYWVDMCIFGYPMFPSW